MFAGFHNQSPLATLSSNHAIWALDHMKREISFNRGNYQRCSFFFSYRNLLLLPAITGPVLDLSHECILAFRLKYTTLSSQVCSQAKNTYSVVQATTYPYWYPSNFNQLKGVLQSEISKGISLHSAKLGFLEDVAVRYNVLIELKNTFSVFHSHLPSTWMPNLTIILKVLYFWINFIKRT